jgi:hypothetical protein
LRNQDGRKGVEEEEEKEDWSKKTKTKRRTASEYPGVHSNPYVEKHPLLSW